MSETVIKVVKQIGPGVVQQVVPGGNVDSVVGTGIRWLAETIAPAVKSSYCAHHAKKESVKVDSISDFWDEKRVHLKNGTLVSIEGQFSQYAPMVLGSPKGKREIHRKYRLSLSKDRNGPKPDRTEVDAKMAYTAGQMVLRLDMADFPWQYMGLYHSIVRNSVPVFVRKDYYEKVAKKVFSEGQNVVEASIVGRINLLPDRFRAKFINENKLSDMITPMILKESKETIAGIMVDGVGTSIKAIGKSRYLDGDIWVALQRGKKQPFVSRFVNLADENDVRSEAAGINDEIGRLYKKHKIVFQYDQVSPLVSGYQTISPEMFARKFDL